uniref:DDE-1 domain-containing protein n=1 Tax=Amphimedon queenslandica TaxID=400682 RepID=A0A1X7UK51_AMPQE
MGFGKKGNQCHGGKKSKMRITVAFFVSAAGKELKPIVTMKSENARYFLKSQNTDLPVTYFSQQKAWMTADIMDAILSKLNRQFSCNGFFC